MNEVYDVRYSVRSDYGSDEDKYVLYVLYNTYSTLLQVVYTVQYSIVRTDNNLRTGIKGRQCGAPTSQAIEGIECKINDFYLAVRCGVGITRFTATRTPHNNDIQSIYLSDHNKRQQLVLHPQDKHTNHGQTSSHLVLHVQWWSPPPRSK